MLRHLLKPVARNVRTGVRSYHIPEDVKPASMDEVVVPSGSWKEANAKIQQKYNLQLVAGVLIFVGTIAVGRVNGTLWLNFASPKPEN